MKFKKQDKEFVVGWVERQFKKNPTFPVSCIDGDKKKNSVSKEHLKSYKTWTKTTHKRSDLQDWIDTWLAPSETEALEAAIARRTKVKTE